MDISAINARCLLAFLCLLIVVLSATSEECYEELGCFPNDYPWFSILRPALPPQSPEKVGTKFLLFTRKHSTAIQIETWPNITVTDDYIPGRPTYFITHGFRSDSTADWFKNLTESLLYRVDANVIAVDWGSGAKTLYVQATSNTRIVGAEIARFINHLTKNNLARGNNMHLLGHSLGSHVMGYVGKQVKGIFRITGLDPAQPLFEGRNEKVRIDTSDAEMVDIIHTNGKPFLPYFGFGMVKSVGDVDFFVNGGRSQPGCILNGKHFYYDSLFDIAEMSVEVILNLITCAHSRAPHYMAAAVKRDCNMWGYRYTADYAKDSYEYENFVLREECNYESCTLMGLETPRFPARGSFALKTTGVYPYCNVNKKSDRQMDIAEKNAEKENKTGFNIFKKICDTITGVIHGIFHHVF